MLYRHSILDFQFTDTSQKEAFIHDYKITACLGLVRWFYEGYLSQGTEGVLEKDETTDPHNVQPCLIQFALNFCRQNFSDKAGEGVQSLDISWDGFLDDYYAIAHKGRKLKVLFRLIHNWF